MKIPKTWNPNAVERWVKVVANDRQYFDWSNNRSNGNTGVFEYTRLPVMNIFINQGGNPHIPFHVHVHVPLAYAHAQYGCHWRPVWTSEVCASHIEGHKQTALCTTTAIVRGSRRKILMSLRSPYAKTLICKVSLEMGDHLYYTPSWGWFNRIHL